MHKLNNRLQTQFELGELSEQRPDLAFVTIKREYLRSLLLHLRDREGFTHLVLLTAVDWIEDGVFQLTYLLCNRQKACDLGVRVMISRDDATIETVHDVWPTAATYQRELREMFGINFPGSPGVDDEFILEGWADIPPYRRDFDTKKFSEANFSHRLGRQTNDPADHMKKQLTPGKGLK